jgi:hypothetical protein
VAHTLSLSLGEVIDCKDHHFGFGLTKWHYANPPAQPTWGRLIRLMLAYRSGKAPDIGDIRQYQEKASGMKNGETCVIELCSLAAPNLNAPGVHGLFLEERIREIRQRILDYKPTFVVMYGVLHKPHWEAITGCPFGPDNMLKIGPTVAAVALHPVSFGLKNSYWFNLAETLRHEVGLTVR